MGCPMCGGPGVLLGVLGLLKHFRCRNCGMMWSKAKKAPRNWVKSSK